MCNDREPYTFKRCMFFVKCDIRRVWKAYFLGSRSADFNKSGEVIYTGERQRCSWKWLPSEFKGIIMEIKHGVFDQGK